MDGAGGTGRPVHGPLRDASAGDRRQREEVSLIGLAGGEEFDRAVDDARLILGRGGAIVETAKDALGNGREVAGETVGRLGRFELAAMDKAVIEIAQRVRAAAVSTSSRSPAVKSVTVRQSYWCIVLSVC